MPKIKKETNIEEAETVENIEPQKETNIEEVKQSAGDKILGLAPQKIKTTSIDYESPKKKYTVTNLLVKNKPITVSGTVIESFIGSINKEARALLKQGADKVKTKDGNGREAFLIEVIK